VQHQTFYRAAQIDGLSVFYREAGPKGAPTILLLHGLPSSSRMFEPLFARLSDSYRLVAPDYPGFGHSDWPDPKTFAYTFDHLAEIVNHFTEALGLSRYTLYMQDYGGPVGFRMALAHPDRIESLIVQNAVAHNDGLGAIWKTRRAFWADRAANEIALRTNLLSLATTRVRIWGAILRSSAMIRISGPMNSLFWDSPGRATFKATCSTTTALMSTPILSGRRGWSRSGPGFSCCGANTTHHSNPLSRRPIDATYRPRKSMFSRPVISHWTPLRMKSRG
jgi:pimeloyl-ACP methyl ester carboxylesterase